MRISVNEVVKICIAFIISFNELSVLSIHEKSKIYFHVSEVIVSLNNYMNSGCISVLYNWTLEFKSLEGLRQIVLFHKRFGYSLKSFSAVSIEEFNYTTQRECCKHNLPFFVALSTTSQFLMKLSLQKSFEHSTWFFYSEQGVMEDYFQGINIPLNSQVLISSFTNETLSVYEIHQVTKNNSYVVTTYSQLNTYDHVKYHLGRFYESRSDFRGTILRVATVEDLPFNYLRKTQKGTVFTGYIGDTMTQLQSQMNFRMEFILPPDKKYGNKENGTWNGLLGLLKEGKADIAATTFLVTRERRDDFDMSVSILPLQYNIIVREGSEKHSGFTGITKPFSSDLWIAIVILIAIAGLLRWFFSSMNPGNPIESQLSLYHALFLTVGCILNMQSEPQTPKFLPTFIIFITSFLVATVLHGAYGAILISFITVTKHRLPFSSLQDIVEDGTFKVGVKKGTAQYQIFRDAKIGTLKDIHDKLLEKSDTGYGNLQHLMRVCEGNYAYIVTRETAYSYEPVLNCTLKSLPEVFGKFAGSMAFPKGSPLTKIFNYNLLKLFSNGFFKKLYIDTWGRHRRISTDNNMEPVDIDNVMPYITILSIGLLTAVIFLLVENIIVSFENHINYFKNRIYSNKIQENYSKYLEFMNKVKNAKRRIETLRH